MGTEVDLCHWNCIPICITDAASVCIYCSFHACRYVVQTLFPSWPWLLACDSPSFAFGGNSRRSHSSRHNYLLHWKPPEAVRAHRRKTDPINSINLPSSKQPCVYPEPETKSAEASHQQGPNCSADVPDKRPYSRSAPAHLSRSSTQVFCPRGVTVRRVRRPAPALAARKPRPPTPHG